MIKFTTNKDQDRPNTLIKQKYIYKCKCILFHIPLEVNRDLGLFLLLSITEDGKKTALLLKVLKTLLVSESL